MPKLTMLKGPSNSGKTQWAFGQVHLSDGRVKRVSRSDLRRMCDGGKWSPQRELAILEARNALVSNFLGDGYDVVVDDTNLGAEHARVLQDIAYYFDAKFEVKEFTVIEEGMF